MMVDDAQFMLTKRHIKTTKGNNMQVNQALPKPGTRPPLGDRYSEIG
jgi:hypothetical protein